MFERKELVVLANFHREELRIAVVHKDDYVSFMEDKSMNYPKGFILIDELTIFVFGDPPKLTMNDFNSNVKFKFLAETREQVPKTGMPPLPPSTVEPEIFKYTKTKSCYSLKDRSITFNLFD